MRNPEIDQVHGHARSWGSAMSAVLVLVLVPVAVNAEPPSESGVFPPVDIPTPPPRPAPPPEPAPPPGPPPDPAPEPPPPDPSAAPVEGPPAPQALSPEQRRKIQAQRWAGIGVKAVGGIVTATGLGITAAFTVVGDAAQNAEEPVTAEVERADALARVGGILIASGAALTAVGGFIFVNAERKLKEGAVARVRVAPALGGLVVSGQF
jgi:outer membrane biosynthesis protein TonB